MFQMKDFCECTWLISVEVYKSFFWSRGGSSGQLCVRHRSEYSQDIVALLKVDLV